MRISDCVIRIRDSKIIKRFNVKNYQGLLEKCGGFAQAHLLQLNTLIGQVQLFLASATIPAPSGLIAMGSGGAITLTIPAPSAAQDGVLAFFYTDTAQAHIVSFTGATLLSVGVAKTTSTSGGLIGEFLLVMARAGKWVVIASAGQTFA